MKILKKIGIGLFLAVVLFGGCSKNKAPKKAAKVVDSTETRTARPDSFPKEPKNFKSIHQLELEQHEKDSTQKSGERK